MCVHPLPVWTRSDLRYHTLVCLLVVPSSYLPNPVQLWYAIYSGGDGSQVGRGGADLLGVKRLHVRDTDCFYASGCPLSMSVPDRLYCCTTRPSVAPCLTEPKLGALSCIIPAHIAAVSCQPHFTRLQPTLHHLTKPTPSHHGLLPLPPPPLGRRPHHSFIGDNSSVNSSLVGLCFWPAASARGPHRRLIFHDNSIRCVVTASQPQ